MAVFLFGSFRAGNEFDLLLPAQKAQNALPARLALCLQLIDPLAYPGVHLGWIGGR
jgi:hypothetical protein